MEQKSDKNKEEVGIPGTREYVFAVNETAGEYVWGVYVGEWLKDEESGSEVRYLLAGKFLPSLKISYVLMAQIKGQDLVTVLDEGACIEFHFKKRWKDFLKEFKKSFGVTYNSHFVDFKDMETERRDMLFNSIISAER